MDRLLTGACGIASTKTLNKKENTMDKHAHLKRARNLIKNGRYQKNTLKIRHSSDRFRDVESIDIVHLDGAEWMPYFDTSTNQLVYGYAEKVEGERIFHYLSFMAFDYFYNASSPFVWDDSEDAGPSNG
jgi:hypothetical protein